MFFKNSVPNEFVSYIFRNWHVAVSMLCPCSFFLGEDSCQFIHLSIIFSFFNNEADDFTVLASQIFLLLFFPKQSSNADL